MAETSINTLIKINKASLRLLQPLTPEQTYSLMVKEAVKLLNAAYGSVLLTIDGAVQRVYSTYPSDEYNFQPRKRGYAYRVFKTRRPLVITTKEFGKIHPEMKRLGIRAVLMMPLSYHHKCIGVLTVQLDKDRHFTIKELNTLKIFGSMATLAIRKAQLYKQAVEASETRKLFLSLAAHELRTPVTSVNGYIQLLYKKLSKQNSVEGEWIKSLYYESIRLTKMVQELLDINRIHTGEFQFVFKECDVKEILNRAISNFSLIYPDRKIIYEDKINSHSDLVIGDFDKLIQVFSNLLDNAVKFSENNTPVSVILKRANSSIYVEVRDHGQGIPEQDRKKIFEGFYKASNNFKEGVGLGLFLCKNVIQKHKGSLQIESKEGIGTTVKIKLPRARS